MRYFWVILTSLFFAGCVTTDFYSKLNPAYPGNIQYQRVLIWFLDNQGDYAEVGEKATEEQIAKNFGPAIQCYRYSKEFYSGITMTAQLKADIHNFEVAKNIDALIICTNSRGTQQNGSWVNNAGHSMYQSDPQNVVGSRMELIDLKAGKSIWFCTDKASGNILLNSDKDLMKGFVERAVLDLKLKELLGVDNRPSFFATPTPQNPVI